MSDNIFLAVIPEGGTLTSDAVPVEDHTASPVRMIFCTSWSTEDGHIDIHDEFQRLHVRQTPMEVTSKAIFLIVFWQGIASFKPLLEIDTPRSQRLIVRLPQLARILSDQVQVYSLAGFCFETFGKYIFRVSVDGRTLGHTLEIGYLEVATLVEDT